VDCCNDCRLQVDVQLPCGSDAAERAQSDAIQNRLTVENIINAMAPPASSNGDVQPPFEKLEAEPRRPGGRSDSLSTTAKNTFAMTGDHTETGIGTMSFEFIRASVFDKALSPEMFNEPTEGKIQVKKGDYFIRVSSSTGPESKRTRTMQNTGRLKFDAGEIKFNM
jgi:hypothetical protein